MEYFSNKAWCGICVSRHLKGDLDWAIDKRVIGIVLLLKTGIQVYIYIYIYIYINFFISFILSL